MPRLVKGGKHAFGWSRVGDAGRIVVPPEALAEYCLKESETLILMPGSQTSGGFGLGSLERVGESPLGGEMAMRSQSGESQESGERTDRRGSQEPQ